MNKKNKIIKNLDSLGRIHIPRNIRNNLELHYNDLVELTIFDNMIKINKFKCRCLFCGSNENIRTFKNKFICKDCIMKIKKI